ncbi:putative oxidoreductase C-terminal domain-containing protein [Mucilaginibacter sp. UR6-11]|uniref:putative oxidoreductase C-terminal domain-containing protein n=1 Tax=Mucilaginibacter sp. UR6-11 TaxID=1435644 RepID=UPI001E63534A|nr:putative oxidoreductase C-terminal domain-containing protein [Mucilaginibacter sp. UR6-11]MCC8426247.1 oxidoreductase [Mucilaginibacter sp. UR6-11]
MKNIGSFCVIICTVFIGFSAYGQLKENEKIKLITLDPGHFHAALVQKTTLPDIEPDVYVYAPKGPDVKSHLDKIDAYNFRKTDPTHWSEIVYTGDDFFNKMIAEKKGNVVVMAGNNQKKTEYIKKSIDAGFNVLGDKPMAIDNEHFEMLRNAFAVAAKKKLVLYDIMTERYEITNTLQREFALLPEVFGQLKKGTPQQPAVEMESVHYFYKYVSGSVLSRPAWFFDVKQQGEGLQDVGVHLVDLTQWECFPEKVINYKKDIQFTSAKRWPSYINLSQFKAITKLDGFPAFLKDNIVKDTILKVYANGSVNYKLFGTNIKLTAKWAYAAPDGSGDSHNSALHGTKADLYIKQGAAEKYAPVLYIQPLNNESTTYEKQLFENLKAIQGKYPGVKLKRNDKGWEVIIPEKYKDGHEAHFGRVTEKYLNYLREGDMPEWEVPNMIAKYYTTTTALTLAKRKH